MNRACSAIAVLFLVSAPYTLAADSAPEPKQALEVSGSVCLTGFSVRNAYFGGAQPEGMTSPDYDWLEAFGRLRLAHDFGGGIYAAVQVIGLGTHGQDYYGLPDDSTALVEQAAIGFKQIGGSGLDLTLGRQDIELGDGFVIGDGYYDHKGARWSIPLNYYDAVRADYAAGPVHLVGFASRLDEATFPQKGTLYGVDALFTPNENASVGLGWYARHDTGEGDNNARAVSLRGALSFGSLRLSGEGVYEYGTIAGADLAGRAYHVDATWNFGGTMAPYLRASNFYFSGDDPNTATNEEYYSWNYRWHDWNQYYIGDVVGSQVQADNRDKRVVLLEAGFKPGESTKVRLFAGHFRLDTGSFFGYASGADHDFADEYDAVFDWTINKTFAIWVMGGYGTPRSGAKTIYGSENVTELLTAITVTF